MMPRDCIGQQLSLIFKRIEGMFGPCGGMVGPPHSIFYMGIIVLQGTKPLLVFQRLKIFSVN